MRLSTKNYHRGDIIQDDLGAILLESKLTDQPEDVYYIVLALIPKQRQYVTWLMDHHGCTFSGHYFLFIEDGLKDFEERNR